MTWVCLKWGTQTSVYHHVPYENCIVWGFSPTYSLYVLATCWTMTITAGCGGYWAAPLRNIYIYIYIYMHAYGTPYTYIYIYIYVTFLYTYMFIYVYANFVLNLKPETRKMWKTITFS